MSSLLAGKLAFVTGAGSGIGRATCQVLAREGARVIASDQNLNSAEETLELVQNSFPNKHLSLELNVGQAISIKSALKNVLEVYRQPPTIIVNSAGITRDNFILKMAEKDFDQVIDINLKGTYLVIQNFAQAIIDNKETNASIINIASFVAKFGNIGQVNYCASKAGVELVTKTAAKELGQFGIRCNAILPGVIISPMIQTIPDKVKEKFMSNIALRRFGKPEEVAEVITFLASDRSSYVNGASIDITGGF